MGIFRERAERAHKQYSKRITHDPGRICVPERVDELFAEAFGTETDAVDGDVVTVDGVKLVYKWTELGLPVWAVLGTCPFCGQEAQSGPVVTLSHVGEILADFRPGFEHRC